MAHQVYKVAFVSAESAPDRSKNINLNVAGMVDGKT